MRTKYLAFIVGLLCICSCQHQQKGFNRYYINAAESAEGTGKDLLVSCGFDKSVLNPGDTLYIIGGAYPGKTLNLDSLSGKEGLPIVIKGNASTIIKSGNEGGIYLSNSQHIRLENFQLVGSGRKEGNICDGLQVSQCKDIRIANMNVTGYQKAGVHIKSSHGIVVEEIHAHNNGSCGIAVSGEYPHKVASGNIVIRNCFAENNPGDPTNLTNHSGSGILVGHSTNVIIEYCSATNNGWDMPRTGNGPIGIWAYEADSVLIQHCISYANKTSKGGKDGGGYDLDGGVTNSIIQYCLSYDNEGSGYGLFQYYGASPWHNNIVRYCISENDGNTSNGMGGIFVWNATGNPEDLRDCLIYNNTVYNDKGGAICYDADSRNKNFYFYNNIFVGKDDLVKGERNLPSHFICNNWFSIDAKGFNMGGIKDFETWARKYGKEQEGNQLIGSNIDPQFKNPGRTTLADPHLLKTYDAYQLPENSVLKSRGYDFIQEHDAADEMRDFNGNPADRNLVGAIR